jgi:hypothetical protein
LSTKKGCTQSCKGKKLKEGKEFKSLFNWRVFGEVNKQIFAKVNMLRLFEDSELFAVMSMNIDVKKIKNKTIYLRIIHYGILFALTIADT